MTKKKNSRSELSAKDWRILFDMTTSLIPLIENKVLDAQLLMFVSHKTLRFKKHVEYLKLRHIRNGVPLGLIAGVMDCNTSNLSHARKRLVMKGLLYWKPAPRVWQAGSYCVNALALLQIWALNQPLKNLQRDVGSILEKVHADYIRLGYAEAQIDYTNSRVARRISSMGSDE